jgi:hypothetical protein
MPDYIRMAVDGDRDGEFLLEVDRQLVRVGRGGEPAELAQESLQRSLDRVRVIAAQVVDKLSSIPRRPERVKVAFGVKLTGEANVIVTRTTGEAHFVVELEWGCASEDAGPRPTDG